MDVAEIKKCFKDNDVPLDKDDVWKVQSAWVVKHSALERLSAAIKIRWDKPVVVVANTDDAVVMVSASRADKPDVMEWSFGEARINKKDVQGNYKVSEKMAAYPWAMAEKRAKDRVIIKLAGLHGAYSETEADEFKQNAGRSENGNGRTQASSNQAEQDDGGQKADDYDQQVKAEKEFRDAMADFKSADDVAAYMKKKETAALLSRCPKSVEAELRDLAKDRYLELKPADENAKAA